MANINQMSGNGIMKTDPHVGEGRRPPKKDLDKEDFMTLFVAQMLSQNPTKPYDGNTMMQQMGQMSSLAATEDLQKTIHSLNYSLGKSGMLSASQLVGRKAHLVSDKSPLIKGEGLRGSALVPAKTEDIVITIKDAKGGIVKTIHKGTSEKGGPVDFDWDGKDANTNDLPEGIYTISATGKINGKQVDLKTAGCFNIESVAMNPMTADIIVNVSTGAFDIGQIVKVI